MQKCDSVAKNDGGRRGGEGRRRVEHGRGVQLLRDPSAGLSTLPLASCGGCDEPELQPLESGVYTSVHASLPLPDGLDISEDFPLVLYLDVEQNTATLSSRDTDGPAVELALAVGERGTYP